MQYGIEDAIKLESEARTKALAEARDKATELAKLSGRQIAELISIAEESGAAEYSSLRLFRGRARFKYVSFSDEPIEISAILRATFSLVN